MNARELLAESLGLGVDDEIDVTLPVQGDVLAAVPRGGRKSHASEQRPQPFRIRSRVLHELESVSSHRIVEFLAHRPLPH